MNFLIFGAGKNQEPLIKISYLKKNNNFVIHNKRNKFASKFSRKFFIGSAYNLLFVKKICKNLKKNNIKINDIICRTTGPSILSAYYASNFFKINRISKKLAKCIYSKSYFSKILKKNNIPFIINKTIKTISNKFIHGEWVLKPDAPLLGKKFIYFLKDTLVPNDKFKTVINNSDNKHACLSEYLPGRDLNAIFFIEKKRKITNFLGLVNEWNIFIKNEINYKNSDSVVGASCPEIGINIKQKMKILKLSKNIINIFPNYYGFISIAFRVFKKKILPYELNINIDKLYATKIFPYFYNNKCTYDLEVSNLMCEKINNLNFNNSRSFFGFLKKKKITNKKNFIKKLKSYYQLEV